MPIRCFQDNFRVQHTLHFTSMKINQDISRSLPYVDQQTGVHNRIVDCDPISGLGNLSPEVNALKGSHINRKQKIIRNPIIPDDQLDDQKGKKLYKPQIYRNPITMEGDFGEPVDLLRPNGRLLVQRRMDIPQRNPINGIGEFGKEWDPIYKYHGKLNIRRHCREKTDPITHTNRDLSDENRTQKKPYFQKEEFFALIGHFDNDERKILHTGRKVYPIKMKSPDIINHEEFVAPKKGSKIHFPTSRRAASNDNIRIRNPITHESYLLTNNENQFAQEKLPNYPTRRRCCTSEYTRIRNPISGEGMRDNDYYLSICIPKEYNFRSYTKPTAKDTGKHQLAKKKRNTNKSCSTSSRG